MAVVLQSQARVNGVSSLCGELNTSAHASGPQQGICQFQMPDKSSSSQVRKPAVHLLAKTSFLPPTRLIATTKLKFDANSNGLPKKTRCTVVEMVLSNGNNGHEGCNLEQDGHYYEAIVTDAVCMLPARGALYMKLGNGAQVEVAHVNPQAGKLLYQDSTPTIFLRMANDRNLMLPIVVSESSLDLIMKGLRNERASRPNPYDLMKDMADVTKHEVRMVKITQRVVDTYYARIYIAERGDTKMKSIDARPSDAISLAVRCKAPIFVNRAIVAADAVQVVQDGARNGVSSLRTVHYNSSRVVTSKMDRVADVNDPVFTEIVLVTNMMVAAQEERYADAARMRDELKNLRRRQESI